MEQSGVAAVPNQSAPAGETVDPYHLDESTGIFEPRSPIAHRDEEYPSQGFESMLRMQSRHFWYRGRHRFIRFVTTEIVSACAGRLEAVDLGGGCGAWLKYLDATSPQLFGSLALADSSRLGLQLAAPLLPRGVPRYHVDLLNLQWHERWDVAFLLDVLEHVPDDERALRQIRAALRPGGHLVMTMPALERFRTRVDDMSRHVRRYSRRDLARRAAAAGFEVVVSRYFMFFLSPLLLLTRLGAPDPSTLTPAEIRDYLNRSDRVPPAAANALLAAIFAMETPLGVWLPFPWGTSVLAVFRRPA